MTAFVVPFETHQTDSRVWVAWWDKDPRPPLALRVRKPNNEVLTEIPLDGAWSSIGLEGDDPDEVVCQYQVVRLDGLDPAALYTLALVVPNSRRTETVGFVETLPERLPDSGDRGQRPFTILLGSCYSAHHDPDAQVDDAYLRLWNSDKHRPHLKILCGDQVYVDQPAGVPFTPMVTRATSEGLRRWFIAKYREAWRSIDDMLQRGANYMTSDDHEFWNDYPERPLFGAWTALHESLQYRRDWGREGAAHFLEIQQGAPATRLDIGADLSIFIADTRINRQRDGVHFMSPEDFDRMIEWIRGLRTPGVLVLGQPLLTQATNAGVTNLDTIIKDRNLPYFVQYDDLMNALSWWCYHDLLVLAGDVHFGRIAKFNIPRNPDIYPAMIYEVVSSAMTVLPSATGRFEIGPGGSGFPNTFPPYVNREMNLLGTRVTYERVLPRMLEDRNATENNFMTLQFTRHPSGHGIQVDVHAWLVNRDPVRGLPASAWSYRIALDVDRPASAFAMIAPPVLDFGDVRRGAVATRDRSLIVSNPGGVPLIVQNISVRGEDDAPFTVIPHPPAPFPLTLQPGQAFPLSVRFQSETLGEHQAFVRLTGADLVAAPVQVEAILLATVVAPAIAVLPTTVNFGLVPVGQQVTRNLIVTNYGSASLRFRVEPPASPAPFQWTGNAAGIWRSLPEGEDAIIAVSYAPTAAGAHAADLLITSDDRPLTVRLVGEGVPPPQPEIRATPRQLNFGVVTVGTTAMQRLTLANDGTAALKIVATRIDGPDRKHFALVGPAPTLISAGQTGLLTVSFAPGSAGAGRQATLVIESNAGNAPRLEVGLAGAGAAPSLRVQPTQIAFNPSPLAATLPPGLGSRRGVDIYNTGATTLTIAGSSFRVLDAANGQVSPHFTILDAAGQPFPQNNLQLNAGAFQSLSVLFRPITAGDHAARIVITPTDRAVPAVTVSITGQGMG